MENITAATPSNLSLRTESNRTLCSELNSRLCQTATKPKTVQKFYPIRINFLEEFDNPCKEEDEEPESSKSCEDKENVPPDEDNNIVSDSITNKLKEDTFIKSSAPISASFSKSSSEECVGSNIICATPDLFKTDRPKTFRKPQGMFASSTNESSFRALHTPIAKPFTANLTAEFEPGIIPNSTPANQLRRTVKNTPVSLKDIAEELPKYKVQCSVDMKAAINKQLFSSAIKTNKSRSVQEVSHSVQPYKSIVVSNVTYHVLNTLGRGGSSVVLHCYEPKSKREFAIKCVDLNQDSNAVAGFLNEVNTLQRLQHCNRIIKLYSYEILKPEKKLLMVMEKGSKDLSQILKELSLTSEHLPTYMLIYYWMEMLYAVKEIHANGVIHSDLKPANFLQIHGRIKLIDFGIASCVQNDMTSVVKNVTLGTFSYISPEALHADKSSNCDSPNYGKPRYKINFKSDVWSLGCILYQLVYRKTPFQHIGHMWAKLSTIMDPNHRIDYPEANWVPPIIIATIKQCLQHDVKSRPSIDELIETFEKLYY